jgi:hypothetical protein
MVLHYLLSARGSKLKTEPQFKSINLLLVLGWMADLLKYDYNREYAVFNMQTELQPISY